MDPMVNAKEELNVKEVIENITAETVAKLKASKYE